MSDQIDPQAHPVVLFGQLFNQLCGERVSPDVAAQVACQLATHEARGDEQPVQQAHGSEEQDAQDQRAQSGAGVLPPGAIAT